MSLIVVLLTICCSPASIDDGKWEMPHERLNPQTAVESTNVA